MQCINLQKAAAAAAAAAAQADEACMRKGMKVHVYTTTTPIKYRNTVVFRGMQEGTL